MDNAKHPTIFSGFRRIYDEPKPERPPCTSEYHNPPTQIALAPGLYEYTCPECGHKTPVRIATL